MALLNSGSTHARASSGLTDSFQHGLLEAVLAAAEEPIFTTDTQGLITSWNNAAEDVFGYRADEIVGQPILRLIPERLHDESLDMCRRTRTGETVAHLETIRLAKSGTEVLVSLTMAPLRDNDGRLAGAAHIARNLTGERIRDRAQRQLAAIVESSEDAIISKSLDSIIQTWNHAAERLFGYTADEIIGRSILTLMPPELHHEEPGIIARLKSGQRIEHLETVRVKKNGERFDVSLTISPIRDEQGNVIGASKILRDISDRKRLQESLLQAEKLAATGRMAASIAHEINNPLEGLLNLIYLARVSADDADQVRGLLTTAEGELARVAHIARQTLGYYRENVSPVRVTLSDLVCESVRVYEPRLRSLKIELHCELGATPPLMLKRGEMMQVVSNLIANSIHAMPRGGHLTLSVRGESEHGFPAAVLEVRDTGTGIPEQHMARIFEPFFTTRSTIGTGIGLWVARQFVEGHGGRIEAISSTAPETHGTTIRISLPMEIATPPQ